MITFFLLVAVEMFMFMFEHSNECENEMVKTITIRDAVYKKLLSAKRKDESFSELFERLTEGRNSVEVLKWLRGTVEFRDKEKLLAEINVKRAERRICS